MAWSIRCNFAPIQSYAQAVKAWKNAVIFPRDREGPRGLVDKRKRHLTIERVVDDIVLRLYGRPIVVWHEDNSVTIHAYPTISTAKFACHCTPVGIYVTSGRDFSVTINGRMYRVKDQITFRQRDNTWKADQITSPWSVPVVNRERAKQALDETNYKEFRSWLQVYVQMAARPDDRGWPDGQVGWINNDKVVEMLRNRAWRDLVARHFPDAWNYPDQVLRKIRQAVYSEYDCIDHKSVPFLG